MTTSTSDDPRALIRCEARRLGFDACGFAQVRGAWPASARLEAFVAAGRHGTMAWMETTAARRSHPSALWPQARSAVVLGMNYGPDADPLAALKRASRATISVYAQGRDYHGLIKGRLKSLGGFMKRRLDGEVKVFVDTAPLMEKPLAARAGVGWQGKHTNLVSRAFGSWLFLGSVLTSLDLPPDEGAQDHCGACRACLDVCPTQAFPAPYQLDARACLSYLTIEHAGPIPLKYREALGNRIYGCDDCLAVCPWNKFAQTAREAGFHARETLRAPALADLAALDDAAFRILFSASPIKRIGRDRFVRNVMYAIGNSGDAALIEVATVRLDDACETVREAAAWALARLEPTLSPTH
ncbi:MAG: tRNA epoxyqueuosine(34) reductase QueG [Caulobacteraceae bacterium]|nr:tRNA epoxyqueuosine(34) reductase QueG [Caulobacteraceae bacterium]